MADISDPEQEQLSPLGPIETESASSDDTSGRNVLATESLELDGSTPQAKNEDEQLLGTLTEISAELSALNSTIENRFRYDKVKEEAFERLYAELESVKRDSTFEAIRPLYSDLILLFDRIENTRTELSSSTSEGSNLAHLLGTLSDELLEILYRREVEVIQTDLSIFDPTVQRAIGTEPISVEAENNQVVRVVRRGFKYRDRVLRAEEVIVKKLSRESGNGS
jgi:molecular chaperone GrpE